MMRLVGRAGIALAFVAVAGLVGCGDAETVDGRGYTKAPLEDPNLFITSEVPTVMDALGEPSLPLVVDPDELAAGATE